TAGSPPATGCAWTASDSGHTAPTSKMIGRRPRGFVIAAARILPEILPSPAAACAAGLTLDWRGCIPPRMNPGWSCALAAAAYLAIAHAAAPQDRAPRPEPRPAKNPLEGNAQAISNGGAMFRTRCAGCHGPDARGYVGPDLTSVWAAGYTDDRLFDVVRRGIPGTEMTPADPQ